MRKKVKFIDLVSDKKGNVYKFPFILTTFLFFMWGFAHGLLDVLDKHFQDSLSLPKFESAMVQTSAYGAYFLMAIPAGIIAKKYGFKKGIISGLFLFAAGTFCFVPAVKINHFIAFLLALLILFCGLTCLETSANPYIISMGTQQLSATRINFAQTFNAVGWIFGPLVGSIFILKDNSDGPILSLIADAFKKVFLGIHSNKIMGTGVKNVVSNDVLIPPYLILGVLVLVLLFVFHKTELPEIKPIVEREEEHTQGLPLYKQKHFVLAVIAQFLYCGAQTGIGSFFINYTIEVKSLELKEVQAGLLLSLGGMLMFAVGRFFGAQILKKVNTGLLLGTFGLINAALMFFVYTQKSRIGILSLILCYLFMSVMFPSIFALGIKNLGDKTKQGSAFIVQMVVGGAIVPPFMGWLGGTQMSAGFIVPLICFAYISYYGFFGSKIKSGVNEQKVLEN